MKKTIFPSFMKVLLACEESQAVCMEFRRKGHEAFSADILDCSGPHPEWHIKGDVLDIIKNQHWDMMIAFPPCTHLAVSGARHFEKKKRDGRQKKAIDFFLKMINAPINKIAVENPIGIMSTNYGKPNQIIHPYHFGDPYSKATCLWLKNLKPLRYVPREDKKKLRKGFGVKKIINYSNSIIESEKFTALTADGGLKQELNLDDQEGLPHEVDKGEFITFSSGKRMAKWYNEASGNGHIRSKTFPGIAKAMADQWG